MVRKEEVLNLSYPPLLRSHPHNPISPGGDSSSSVYVALFCFCLFFVCFFKYEAIAMAAGVNSKEVNNTKSSEMFNDRFYRMITSPLYIG